MSSTVTVALAVFAAGFLGGLSRWALTRALPERVGTWASNMIGASVLGFAVTLPGVWQIAAGAGFAGAISTFSTLAKEIGELIQRKQWGEAGKYVLGTAIFGLVAAAFGMRWGLRGGFA